MAEGKERSEWRYTSKLIASIATMFSVGKKYSPADFDPYEQADLAERSKANRKRGYKLPIEILKPLFGIKD